MEWVNRFVLNPICLVIYHLLPRILFASNTFLRRTNQKRLKLTYFARAFERNHENVRPFVALKNLDSWFYKAHDFNFKLRYF